MKNLKDSNTSRCLYCTDEVQKRKGRWRGHVIPRKLGGSLEFVVPVCKVCNSEIGGLIESKAVDHELFYLHRLLLGINANSGKPPEGHRVRGRDPESSASKQAPQKPSGDPLGRPEFDIEGRMSPSLGKSTNYEATKPRYEFDGEGDICEIAGGDLDQLVAHGAGIQFADNRLTLVPGFSFLMAKSFDMSTFKAPLDVLGAKIALESLAFLGHVTDALLARFPLLLKGANALEVLASRPAHRRLDEPAPFGLVSHVIRFFEEGGELVCRVEYFGMYHVDFKVSEVLNSTSANCLRGAILICDPSPIERKSSFARIPLGAREPVPIGFGQHRPRMLTEAESEALGEKINGEQNIDNLLTIHAMRWAQTLRDIESGNSPPIDVFRIDYHWKVGRAAN
ncbi:MAG: HNH endonuclease [Candidatus Sumerlaeia bacterium]|nr:HNH endonuclease [Candidatus Sumerlaeia bacterium]